MLCSRRCRSVPARFDLFTCACDHSAIALALVAGVVGSALALAMAYLFARARLRAARLIRGLADVPATVPGAVLGLGYLVVLDAPPGSVALALVVWTASVVFWTLPGPLHAAGETLRRVDPSTEAAALGLGAALRNRGHRVTLAGPEPYRGRALALGLGFSSLATPDEVGRMLAERAVERLGLNPAYFSVNTESRSLLHGSVHDVRAAELERLLSRFDVGVATIDDVFELAHAVADAPSVREAQAILRLRKPRNEQEVGALFMAASRLVAALPRGRKKRKSA